VHCIDVHHLVTLKKMHGETLKRGTCLSVSSSVRCDAVSIGRWFLSRRQSEIFSGNLNTKLNRF